jgi:MFS family permease
MTDRASTLGSLEKAAFRSRWRDGVVDLLGGIGVLLVGAMWSMDIFWAAGLPVPILLVAWILIRKRIVEPRIGRVTFKRERREREEGLTKAGVWFGVGVLLFFVALSAFEMRHAGGMGAWFQERAAALPVTLLALMALQAAIMTGVKRFIGYAALFLATGSVATRVGLEPGPQILIGGGIVFVSGLFLFIRFLSRHPIRSVEEVDL